MSLGHGPSIVRNGLVLCLDAANPKSYSGSGTNIINLVNNNSGALLNGTGFSDNAFIFDGSNDKITTDVINALTQFTYEIVFKRIGNGYLIYKNNSMNYTDNSDNGDLYLSSGYIGFHIEFQTTDNDYNLTSSFVTNTTNYYIVHATFDSNKVQRLYINGLLDVEANRSSEGNNIFNSNNFYSIGVQGYSNHAGTPTDKGFFQGSIAVVKIYNRALSAQEIQQNFNALRDRYNV
jgi:hypothetical protein